jgi:hypothetical protein
LAQISDLAKDCPASYRKAGPEVRKMWIRALFRTIRVRGGGIQDFTYEEPFAFLGSHKESMVEVGGRYSNQLDQLFVTLSSLVGAPSAP